MSTVLIVGATRGLGASLASNYAGSNDKVLATSRSPGQPSSPSNKNITWIPSIELTDPNVGSNLSSALKALHSTSPIDLVIISAGYFGLESFDEPDWDKEVKMYTTSSVAPVFLVHHLVKDGCLAKDAKVILVSSESGSIGLRHQKEGGGNFGHHASKAALNMVGKLLSLDLKEKGIAVGIVHPGFMRTEMTKGVGFDKFWDDGGAVTPDEAAGSLVDFIKTFNIDSTGQYWAPRGPRDIGTAEETMGKNLSTPLQLPW